MTATRVILIVDDHRETREVLADLLAALGYEVHQADHGRAALDRLAQGLVPDLLLLDLNMPVMDGRSFLAQLRRSPRNLMTPTIVFSGEYPPGPAPEGVRAVLSKPVDVDRLVQEVEEACRHLSHAA